MPTIKIYSKEQVDALIAGAGGLPDPASASAGDVLTLDSNKDPAWAEPDPGLPDTTSASAGDVLTLDSNKDPAWTTPAGGSGLTRHTYATFGAMRTDILAHFNECIVYVDYFGYYKNPVELISNNQKSTLDIVMTRIGYSTSGNGSMSINRFRTGQISASDTSTSKTLYYSVATMPVGGTVTVTAEALNTYTFNIAQFSVYY